MAILGDAVMGMPRITYWDGRDIRLLSHEETTEALAAAVKALEDMANSFRQARDTYVALTMRKT